MSLQAIKPEEYQGLVQKLLQQSGATSIVSDPLNFSISFELESKARIKLKPWYTAHHNLGDTEMRRAIRKLIAEFQKKLAQANPQLQQIKLQLMPIVRDKRYFSLAQLQVHESASKSAQDKKFALRKLAGEMVMALGLEESQGMRVVTQDQLEEWQLSFDQIWQIALKNLRERSANSLRELSPGLYCSVWQDQYDSSRCLLPELYQGLRLMGDPVFAFPTRSPLLIAGSQDLTGLQALVNHTVNLLQQSQQALSAELLLYANQQWQSFNLHGEAAMVLRNQQTQILAHDYAQQKQLLSRLLEQQGKTIHIAPFETQNIDNSVEISSVTQFTMGVPSLLPQADQFAVLDTSNDELITVDWGYAQQVFGTAMQKQALYPKRYLLSGLASAEQMKLLRLHDQVTVRATS